MSRRHIMEKEMLRRDIARHELEWTDVMTHMRYLINEKIRIEAILCNLRNKMTILCNQENAVETPVEPVCVASATSEPNGEMEAQKQR